MTRLPKYTVFTNLVSPESNEFVGMSWEFFVDEGHASLCYQRHLKAGNVPSIRAFHRSDIPHMGAAHRDELAELTSDTVRSPA